MLGAMSGQEFSYGERIRSRANVLEQRKIIAALEEQRSAERKRQKMGEFSGMSPSNHTYGYQIRCFVAEAPAAVADQEIDDDDDDDGGADVQFIGESVKKPDLDVEFIGECLKKQDIVVIDEVEVDVHEQKRKRKSGVDEHENMGCKRQKSGDEQERQEKQPEMLDSRQEVGRKRRHDTSDQEFGPKQEEKAVGRKRPKHEDVHEQRMKEEGSYDDYDVAEKECSGRALPSPVVPLEMPVVRLMDERQIREFELMHGQREQEQEGENGDDDDKENIDPLL